MTTLRILVLVVVLAAMGVFSAQAGTASIELSSRTATPGATLSLSGKGFGNFKSVQINKVTVNGVPALIQRWESDLIEVKVPFKATSGAVEVMVGKKKLPAGTLSVVHPRIESTDTAVAGVETAR